jgi:hypothetical protein
MGNFLFECASSMAYAWDHNLSFTTPHSTNDEHWNPIYLKHLENSAFDASLPSVAVTEKQFPHHQREFQEAWRRDFNIVLHGYWQTEKYFKKYRNRILEAFRFPWLQVPGTVSVHVRRGDYLTIKKVISGREVSKHPPVPKPWIEAQMARFPGHQFAFFSDDIAWCKQEFGARADCVFGWSSSTTHVSREEQDLIAMSWCEHHICSASTFSWWGMYLNQNPNKRVIFPKHWITPGWGNLDFRDVIPDWCERA